MTEFNDPTEASLSQGGFFVPFTMFVLPNGRKIADKFMCDQETADHAEMLLKEFPQCRFECEVLMTDDGHFTFTDPELGDLASKIVFKSQKDRREAPKLIAEWIKSLDPDNIRTVISNLMAEEQEDDHE